jgi:hypothetical protein
MSNMKCLIKIDDETIAAEDICMGVILIIRVPSLEIISITKLRGWGFINYLLKTKKVKEELVVATNDGIFFGLLSKTNNLLIN